MQLNGDADIANSIAHRVVVNRVGDKDVMTATEVRQLWNSVAATPTSDLELVYDAIACIFADSRLICDNESERYAMGGMRRGGKVPWPALHFNVQTGKFDLSEPPAEPGGPLVFTPHPQSTFGARVHD